MERNQLKIRILDLAGTQAKDSYQIRELLESRVQISLTQRAVEMAVMRYWRQGLLRRERKGRRFVYSITDRGLARLDWLSKQKNRSQVVSNLGCGLTQVRAARHTHNDLV